MVKKNSLPAVKLVRWICSVHGKNIYIFNVRRDSDFFRRFCSFYSFGAISFQRFPIYWFKISLIEFLRRWKINKSNQITSKRSLAKFKTHFNSVTKFGISTKNVEFSATWIFCASKLRVPTTFNTDICSLALVHYADNSNHSCGGPTFEINYVCLEAMLAKMLNTFLRGFGEKRNLMFACV